MTSASACATEAGCITTLPSTSGLDSKKKNPQIAGHRSWKKKFEQLPQVREFILKGNGGGGSWFYAPCLRWIRRVLEACHRPKAVTKIESRSRCYNDSGHTKSSLKESPMPGTCRMKKRKHVNVQRYIHSGTSEFAGNTSRCKCGTYLATVVIPFQSCRRSIFKRIFLLTSMPMNA